MQSLSHDRSHRQGAPSHLLRTAMNSTNSAFVSVCSHFRQMQTVKLVYAAKVLTKVQMACTMDHRTHWSTQSCSLIVQTSTTAHVGLAPSNTATSQQHLSARSHVENEDTDLHSLSAPPETHLPTQICVVCEFSQGLKLAQKSLFS